MLTVTTFLAYHRLTQLQTVGKKDGAPMICILSGSLGQVFSQTITYEDTV